jgi:hypothetical protein
MSLIPRKEICQVEIPTQEVCGALSKEEDNGSEAQVSS